MKKILFSIIIILLLILCGLTMWKGQNLFGLEIIGFKQVQEKNERLDATIAEATKLASRDYENTLSNIKNDLKKLKEEKKTYDELVAASTGKNAKITNQYKKYEVEYLWTTIGKIATSEGVEIKMDLVNGLGKDIYNLNFTVTGSYVGIADFIYDIENNSQLGFKIENFAMVPGGSTESLQATFTCKNIEIKELSKSSSSAGSEDEESTQNQNTEGNTNQATTNQSANQSATSNTTPSTAITKETQDELKKQ